MIREKEMKSYQEWCQKAVLDPDLQQELTVVENNASAIEERFYQDLSFGTGGLRGIMGAGTNRMNIYTVARASKGLADYLKKKFPDAFLSVAIARDSRIKSDLFERTAAEVFMNNGIRVYLYPEIAPVPFLSYAVRYLHCHAGIMITASHNSRQYNGYKVYDSNGCQITTEAAGCIQQEFEKLDYFEDVEFVPQMHASSLMQNIPDTVMDAYREEVKKQSLLEGNDPADRSIRIVYSPLNGTGLNPVVRVLKESGFENVILVDEQKEPDGNFPTCPSPNPEKKEAMKLCIQYAENNNADLAIATDPDCDRCAAAVKDKSGHYQLLSANETGILLLDYICSMRLKHRNMMEHPLFYKTIVTSALSEKIASHYGVHTVNVLTGFKYIGEQIGRLERTGRINDFLFAFEESCGFLSGTYVRDKDGVNAALLIAEMTAYYKSMNSTLPEKLEELYKTYGYEVNQQRTYAFEGISGRKQMSHIMDGLRNEYSQGRLTSFGDETIVSISDYSLGINGLPAANVLRFQLDHNGSVIIRPSGTEPKLKIYISVISKDKHLALQRAEKIRQDVSLFCSGNVR